MLVLLCSNGVRSGLTVSQKVLAALTFINTWFWVLFSVLVATFAVHWVQWTRGSRARGDGAIVWPTHPQMDAIVRHGPQLDEWKRAIVASKDVLARVWQSSLDRRDAFFAQTKSAGVLLY